MSRKREEDPKIEKSETEKEEHLSFLWEKWIIKLLNGLNPDEEKEFKQDLKDFGLSQVRFDKYRKELKDDDWEEEKIIKEKEDEFSDLRDKWNERLIRGLSPEEKKEFSQDLKNAGIPRKLFDIENAEYLEDMSEALSGTESETEKIEKDKKIAEARGEIDVAFEEGGEKE